VRVSSSIFCGKKIPSSIGKEIQPIRWIYELNLCLSILKGTTSPMVIVLSSEVRLLYQVSCLLISFRSGLVFDFNTV
jgi:hypothetical protein